MQLRIILVGCMAQEACKTLIGTGVAGATGIYKVLFRNHGGRVVSLQYIV